MKTVWVAKSYCYENEPDSFCIAFITTDKAKAEAWRNEFPGMIAYREIEEVEVC